MDAVIVVAGATGNLGGRIVRALIARGATVRVLVRRGTTPEKIRHLDDLGATVTEVDFADAVALTSACQGASCVVSALSGLRDVIVHTQAALLDAAVAAGVPRFIPSDFSIDFLDVPAASNRNLALRREFHRRLEKAPIAATSILCGAFMDLLTGQAPIILFKLRRVLFWQNADQRMDFTSMDDAAAFTAAVALDPSTPRTLRIAGDQVNARELAALMSEISGEKFSLLRAGSLGLLRGLTGVMRRLSPAPGTLYPPWQGMQYLASMFAGQGKFERLDNSRYPDLEWQTVHEVLARHHEATNPRSPQSGR